MLFENVDVEENIWLHTRLYVNLDWVNMRCIYNENFIFHACFEAFEVDMQPNKKMNRPLLWKFECNKDHVFATWKVSYLQKQYLTKKTYTLKWIDMWDFCTLMVSK